MNKFRLNFKIFVQSRNIARKNPFATGIRIFAFTKRRGQ